MIKNKQVSEVSTIGTTVERIERVQKENCLSSYEEYLEVSMNQKANGAPGPDSISNEVFKQGYEELPNILYRLVIQIWRHTTRMLDE